MSGFNEVNLNDFQLGAVAYRGSETQILLATRKADGARMLIRTAINDKPSLETIHRFEYESHFFESLRGTSFVEYETYGKTAHSFAIIFKHDKEMLLSQLIDSGSLSIEAALEIACNLATAINKLHERKIIHKDIRPQNILVNPQTKEIKIINFASASELTQEKLDLEYIPAAGSLPYISPEQTGRVNRHIDYRTDYYLFGATLFEMLTNQLPFERDRPEDMLFAHIAEIPQRVDRINHKVPAPVASIVEKLLQKDANDRYQSGYGLIVDLKHCLEEYRATAKIEPFAICAHDKRDFLVLPERLYGREAEVHQFREILDKALTGIKEVIFLSGDPGIGKTSLVKELYRPIAEKHALYASGKYQQLKRDIPYVAITEILQEITRSMCIASKEKYECWTQSLKEELGSEARILLDFVPAFLPIFGEMNTLVKLDAVAEQERFNRVISKFLEISTRNKQVLIAFIDDLQWADIPSLNLIREVAATPSLKNILFILSWRANEVDETHPLNDVLKVLKNEISTHNIHLQSISESSINKILSDALQESIENTKELARLINEKTKGNPFFVLQFLETIYENGLLKFDHDKGAWTYDLLKISQEHYTDNIISILEERLKGLSDKTMSILEIASCVGSTFDLKKLVTILCSENYSIFKDLVPAIEQNFIETTDQNVRYAAFEGKVSNIKCNFIHDRIQQAVYARIQPAELESIHYQIARHLRQSYTNDELKENIFEIVDHYNLAFNLIKDPQEIQSVIELNLFAVKRSMEAIALDSTISYLNFGLKLIEKIDKETVRNLYFSLISKRAETLYRMGELHEAEKDCAVAYKYSASAIDTLNVLDTELHIHVANKNFKKAKDIFLKNIYDLGILKQYNPFNPKILYQNYLIKNGLIDFKARNKIINEEQEHIFNSVCGLYSNLVHGIYFSDKRLLQKLSFDFIRLYFDWGLNPLSIQGINSNIIVAIYHGNLDMAISYGEIYQKYSCIIENPHARLVAEHISICFHRSLLVSLSKACSEFEKNYEFASTVYNKEWMSISLGIIPLYQLFQGKNIDVFFDTVLKYRKIAEKLKNRIGLLYLNMCAQICENLRVSAPEPWVLKGKYFDEEKELAELVAQKLTVTYYRVIICKAIVAFHMGRYELVFTLLKGKWKYYRENVNMDGLHYSIYYLLSVFSCWKQMSFIQKIRELPSMISGFYRIRKLSKSGPINFLYQYKEIKGCLFELLGMSQRGLSAFSEAITLASEGGLLLAEGELKERMYKILFSNKAWFAAQLMLKSCLDTWKKLGWPEKSKQLHTKLQELAKITNIFEISEISDEQQKVEGIEKADFNAIISAFSVISEYHDLSMFVEKLLDVIMKNAGAEKGILFFDESGTLEIRAYKNSGQDQVVLAERESGKDNHTTPQYSQVIVTYVQRSQNTVVLANASQSDYAGTCTYLQQHHTKSLLCIPLTVKKKVTAILYLENAVSQDVFNEKRTSMIQLLAYNIALALDQARLYDDAVKMKKAYKRFLPESFIQILHTESVDQLMPGDSIQKEATVFFSDIRNYTTISERLGAKLYSFLNEYYSYASPAIMKNEGFIMQFIGDCIFAVFPQKNHAACAIQAAKQVVESVKIFNALHPEEGLSIGIGLDRGMCVFGLLGERHRLDASVVGDVVNSASRIEGLNKMYGTQLLVSQNVLDAITADRDFTYRLIDHVYLKGKNIPARIYEILDVLPSERIEEILCNEPLRNAAVEAYVSGDFEYAITLFEKYREKMPDNVLADTMSKRCKILIALKPMDWKGIYQLDAK